MNSTTDDRAFRGAAAALALSLLGLGCSAPPRSPSGPAPLVGRPGPGHELLRDAGVDYVTRSLRRDDHRQHSEERGRIYLARRRTRKINPSPFLIHTTRTDSPAPR